MNKILCLIAVCGLLISCQKEIRFSTPGSVTSGTNGSLLVKTVTKTSTDSSQVIYMYDANKRLVRQITSGTSAGQDLSSDISFVRNSSGIVTQTIFKSPALQAFGLDSLLSKVYYDNNSKKYISTSQVLDLYGISVIDSTVYSYSGNNIVEANEYQTFSGLTYLALKSDFSYVGSNLTTVKSYATDSTGALALVSTYKITYDNKTSPLILPPGEAFVLGNYFLVSTNNPLSIQILDGSGGIILSDNLTYKYNSFNVPQTASMLDTSGGTTNITYYYQ